MPLTLDKQNEYRRRYAATTSGWQPATERYEATIRQHLRVPIAVLDMGCGRGGVLEQLGEAVSHPFGVDPDWQSLAEHRLSELPRAVALADALPFHNASFDMVLCSWVLEHVSNPTQTFSEVARVLRQGGWFIFLTPNKHSLVATINRTVKPLQSKLVPRLYGREEADTFPVVYRANTTNQIQRLAGQSGLQLVDLYRIEDPTYLAFHPLLFQINVLLSRFLAPRFAEHLVGVLQKPI